MAALPHTQATPGWGDESGQSVLEYAMLVALMFLIFIVLDRWAREFVPDWHARLVTWISGPGV